MEQIVSIYSCAIFLTVADLRNSMDIDNLMGNIYGGIKSIDVYILKNHIYAIFTRNHEYRSLSMSGLGIQLSIVKSI